MTDDPGGLPIREYIVRGAVQGALAAARQLTDDIGVTLNQVLASLQGAASPAPPEHRTGYSSISGSAIAISATSGAMPEPAFGGTAVTKSVTYADFLARAIEEFPVVRHADVEELGRSRFDLATVSLKKRLLAAIVLIAAVYPILPPEVQKWLLTEANLAAAFAQIFSLLKF